MHPSFEDRAGRARPGVRLAAARGGRPSRARPGSASSASAWQQASAVAAPASPDAHSRGRRAPVPGHADRHPPARDRDPAAGPDRPPARDRALARHRPRRDGGADRPCWEADRGPDAGRAAPARARPAGMLWRTGSTGRGACAHAAARCRTASSRSPRTCARRRQGCSDVPPGAPALDPQRRRRVALRPPPVSIRPGAAGALAALARRGTAGMGRVGRARHDRATGDEDLRWFEAGPARRARARAAVRGPVHRGEAACPLLMRAYARARERFVRLRRRWSSGEGSPANGRASTHTPVAREVGERRHLLRRVARAHRAARGPRLRRRDGRAVRARGFRPDAGRGHGVRPARDRDAQRRSRVVREHGPGAARTAGCSTRTTWTGSTDALVEAVNDEQARRVRGETAYRQIRRSHSWEATAARFEALYEELAGTGRCAPVDAHR